MGILNQTNKAKPARTAKPKRRAATQARRADVEASEATDAEATDATVWAPPTGAYLTDETGLFRVADAFSNSGELFLELENCVTFGLVLCPARTVAKLGLRIVRPTASRSIGPTASFTSS